MSIKTDDAVVEDVYQNLSEQQLLPEEHLMDTGYVTAEHFANSTLKPLSLVRRSCVFQRCDSHL